MRYYVDSCIWIDYAETRKDRFLPLDEWAFRFLNKAVTEESTIMISDALIGELTRRFGAEVERIMSIVPTELRLLVTTTQEQAREALMLGRTHGVPRNDALHAVLARDAGAMLVTRDKHFDVLPCEHKKPEELL